MLPKKVLLVLVLVVVAIIVAGLWLGLKFLGPKDPAGPSEYSAVYLTTGDIYFGKLDMFPWPRMKNVWYLQRGVNQQNQQQLGLAQLKSAFWGPVDEIYLNPKEIVFWTSLRNDSQVAQAFANPSALQQAQQQPGQQGVGGQPVVNGPGVQQPNSGNFQGPTTPPPSSR
jgi:hypothetical protein